MIKTILKPFLRIIACLMYIPLAIITLLLTSIVFLFLCILAVFGFIFTGDIYTYTEKLADLVDKYEYIDKYLGWFILDEDACLILNYNDMVLDKINKW